MLVIARCDRTVDTSCLCKWKVRVMCATVVAHFAELIVVFSIETYNRCLSIWNSVILLINWQKNFVPSNSVSNHTQDKQIGPRLAVVRMITDWIRLHSEKFAVRWEKHIFSLWGKFERRRNIFQHISWQQRCQYFDGLAVSKSRSIHCDDKYKCKQMSGCLIKMLVISFSRTCPCQ